MMQWLHALLQGIYESACGHVELLRIVTYVLLHDLAPLQ